MLVCPLDHVRSAVLGGLLGWCAPELLLFASTDRQAGVTETCGVLHLGFNVKAERLHGG